MYYQWVYNENDSKSSQQCFTIRDINSTIKSISQGEEPSDAVNCFYGTRYKEKIFHHLMQIHKEKYKPLYKNLNLITLKFYIKFCKELFAFCGHFVKSFMNPFFHIR